MEDYDEHQSKTLLSASALIHSEKFQKSKTHHSGNLKGSSCCFSISSPKQKRRQSMNDNTDKLQQFYSTSVFQQAIPQLVGKVTWIQDLIKKADKIITSSLNKLEQLKHDFHTKSKVIYETQQQFGIKIKKDEIQEQEERMARQRMINSKMTNIQQSLFDEIEIQVLNKTHPVQLLNKQFQKSFLKNYHQFVNKQMITENEQLLENIIKQTVDLQSNYAFHMAEKITKEADHKIEEEMQRKKEITVANQALDELKAFQEVLYLLIMRLYYQSGKKHDMEILQEDLLRILANMMINNNIYYILISLMRIDNFDADKDMRVKYSMLKGVKTTDFGIDPYLNMNDPITLVAELSKLSGILIETDRDMLQNPTVQNFEIEDIVNIEFKEYFKTNIQHIKQLPIKIQMVLYEKSKIKPFKKSVQSFRQIMLDPCSPMQKLFQLQDLLNWQIPNEVQEFWENAIKNDSKLVINREEQISIMLFIIVKAQIPDLITQLKLIREFTSQDIQQSNIDYSINSIYSQIYSTIKWFSSLDQSQLQDKSYLLKANVQIKEEEDIVRYDKIKFKEGSDKFDPFRIDGGSLLDHGSYIDPRRLSIMEEQKFNIDESTQFL